jgi:hypothetical protein
MVNIELKSFLCGSGYPNSCVKDICYGSQRASRQSCLHDGADLPGNELKVAIAKIL